VPIYEYKCESCSHKFEQLQKMSDPVLKQCPECQQPDLRKLISSAGFQLKGNGWYVTDFKNSGNSKQKKDGVAKSSGTTATAKSKSNTE